MDQRDDLGGLTIPGVTVVDPAMRPRSYTTSLIGSQAGASTLSMIGVAPGGTALQAVAAAAMLVGDRRGSSAPVNPEDVGKPSQSALDMARRLRESGAPASPEPPDPKL